ncbi:uncharacterized protein LOC119382513 isoform X4 [Rhipicephalus sanguineus]|uniref:uncharacterized protein LOC119382513 isoform X4 n=1 Tax=Rhipicephalus sanguineus TaxID=34632 RepID=UPI0018937C39|nr:uncharacterized protein LOC119382513 isoform X4 [Rhipicephalus sanguineus]
MDDCFDRLMFKNRPGIQTASSIFFTVNSILVMVFLFSVLMAEDAAVQLKLSSIDSNPAEIQFAGSLVVSSFYISSLMDLYLIIGIEDVALIGPFVGTAGLFVLLKAYFTRKVYRYSMLVLNPDFVAAEVAEMSAAAAAAERLSQPPPTFAPHRDSAEYVQLNKFG